MANPTSKRDSLNLRILPNLRELIDRGAEAQGKNRTDFILDAARKAAEEALLDRSFMMVSAESHAAFLKRLDAPPKRNDKLKRVMQTQAPWERK